MKVIRHATALSFLEAAQPTAAAWTSLTGKAVRVGTRERIHVIDTLAQQNDYWL